MARTAPSRSGGFESRGGVLHFPLTLKLRPSRLLRWLTASGFVTAAFVLAAVPDRWGVLAAAILVLSAVALQRWNARQNGKAFALFADGTWRPTDCQTPMALSPSSVDLGGILWLHGSGDDGRRRALMVLPDACASPQTRRWLRIWFHNVAQSNEAEKLEEA